MLIIMQNILSHFTYALSVHAAPGYKAVLMLISFLDKKKNFIKIQQNLSEQKISNAFVKYMWFISVFAIQFSSDDCF